MTMTKLIRLGETFHGWTDAEKIKHLHSGWSASNEALDQMQNERNELLDGAALMETQLQNADQKIAAQKAIIDALGAESNEHRQSDAEEIRILRDRVKAQDAVIEGRGLDGHHR